MTKLNLAELPQSARCAECEAPLTWEKYPNGERVPVDLAPNTNGNIEIRKGTAHRVDATTLAFFERYTSHLDTCSARKGAPTT